MMLGKKREDGTTLEDHLQSVYDRTGRLPEQLEPIEVPAESLYLWSWYCELSETRQSGFGVSGITYTEISAWAERTHRTVTCWELEVIKELDRAYLKKADEDRPKPKREGRKNNGN